jgi:tetratricopeptide (TPR) repeat protein
LNEHIDRLNAALQGRYTIQRELGSGGMATVYLAQDIRHDREVAIKVLRPDLAAVLGPERFLQEIKIAAQLQHPNILPLHDSGEADGFLYYVMPYVEGQSLRDKLAKEGELPIGEAVRILRDIVDALTEAHAHGVVHRDIKPENVLLRGRHALVTDFGVAKAVSEATGRERLTTAGVALGTPAYMAPEQASADPHLDQRVDIYAMGAVAYELLTGRAVFLGTTPQMVLSAHMTEPPQPLTKYRQSIPAALEAIVLRCLEKRPADRWQSADELLPHLESLATPSSGVTPSGTQPISGADYEAAARRAHPVLVAALLGIGAVAVLALLYGLVMLLGLPDWVMATGVALVVLALPLTLLTEHHERQRALERTTGAAVPTPPGSVRRWFTWKTALTAGGLAAAGLTVAAGGFMALRAMGIGPAATLVSAGILEERERIVLAQFENRTSDSTLGQTVTGLFRIDVAQSPAIVLLEPPHVGAVLTRMMRDPDELLTAELAREVAQREGLKAVLAGEVLSVGSGFAISSRLVQASTGDVLWAKRERASSEDEIMGAVDRLSAGLRERVGESLRSIRAEPPPWRYSTASLEALRKYTEAERLNDQGDFRTAIALLEEAIGLDSTFAMAYRKLGIVLGNTGGDLDRRYNAYAKAYELRDRLTDRERYIVEDAYEAYVNLDPQAAITALRRLLERYPEDPIGLNNIAVRYAGLRRWSDAEIYYRRLMDLGYPAAATYAGFISVQFAQGKYAAAESTLAQFREAFPRNISVAMRTSLMAASRGDFDAARLPLQQALAAGRGDPLVQWGVSMGLSAYDYAEGKAQSGERLLSQALAAQEERGLLATETAFIAAMARATSDLWLRDDPAGAVRNAEEALVRYPMDPLDPADRPYLLMARIYALAGRPAQANGWLRRFETETDEWRRKAQRVDYHEAKGLTALAEERFDSAAVEFREAHEESANPIDQLFNLAVTFDRAGRADSAIAYYEEYIDTPYLLRTRTPVFQAVAYRSLGRLYEQQDDAENAAEYYNRFIELWRDADPELQPQVEDVRRRIARLVGEPRR